MDRFTFRSENRLLVHLRSLVPSLNFYEVENYLKKNGYKILSYNIITEARCLIGKGYKRGSKKTDSTFDCSSFTQYAYSQIGVYIPRISIDQFGYGNRVENNFIPGDLIFSSGKNGYYHEENPEIIIGHVGIYTGSTIIHAANTERGIVEDTFDNFFENNTLKPIHAVRIHEHLNDAVTLILPENCDIDCDSHLKWRLLATCR